MEMIKFNYMLEIDISRNSSPRKLGVLRGAFEGFGVQKDTQTPCWLRPCNPDRAPLKEVLGGQYNYREGGRQVLRQGA